MHGRISFKEYRDALDKWNETTTKFTNFYKGLASDEFTSKITKAVHEAKSQLKDCIEKWAVEAEEETNRDEFVNRWENGKPVLTPEQKYLGEKIGDLMDKVKEGGLKSAEVIHVGETTLLGQPLIELMLNEEAKKEVEGYSDEEMKSHEEIILSSVVSKCIKPSHAPLKSGKVSYDLCLINARRGRTKVETLIEKFD